MGYETWYQISGLSEEAAAYMFKKIGNGFESYLRDDVQVYSITDTWYRHEHDLVEISKKFQNDTITVLGAGENSGDLWKKYFQDGGLQYAPASITFDEFDPKKLEQIDP